MALILRNRVRETSTTSGVTVAFVLGGAVANHAAFSSVMANLDTTWAIIVNPVANEWEFSVNIAYTTATNSLGRNASLVVDGSAGAGVLVNFSAGTKEVFMDFPASFAKLVNYTEATVASAATADIGAPGAVRVNITGVSGITSFGTGAANANLLRVVRFTSALAITHNVTSLICPGAASFTTTAGDTAIIASDASGNWRFISYMRNGAAAAQQKYNTTSNTVGFTLTGADLVGGSVSVWHNLLGNLGAGANATLPTAANLIAAFVTANILLVGGGTYELNIMNTSGGAFSWTVVTNTGWTLTGTMTIAQNTFRRFLVTFNSTLTSATLQSLGQYAINAGI